MKGISVQDRQVKILGVAIVILTALLCFYPPQVSALTAQEYISNGEDAFYSETIDNILLAHSIFQNGQAAYPSDPVLNGYLALTRLFHLALTSNSGGLQELLTSYGVVRTGFDLDTLDYESPEDEFGNHNLPGTAPTTESVRAFMAGALLNAIDASIGNLDTTIDNWNDSSKHIVAKEKRGTREDLEIDYGDAYLLRAILKELKSKILTITAYDLNVDIREIAALDNIGAFSETAFLDRYQDFLRLIPTTATPVGNGTNQLALARTTLMAAIDDYITASQKIRSDTDLNAGAEEWIEINECDYLLEEWVRDGLTGIKTTLSNAANPATEIPDQEEGWLFTDVATSNQIWVILERNKSKGEFNAITVPDFVGAGDIVCLTITGDQIYIEMESAGWPYSEVAFTGTLNGTSDAISGSYNGWDGSGPISGSFTASRISLVDNTDRINLNPLFGNGSGPYDLRDFLPDFNACDDPIPGTVGFGLNPSVPDATLGGILPDYIQDDWKLDPVSCYLSGTTVTGILSVPNHNGKGLVYIQVYYYPGLYDTDPDMRLGYQVIYGDEFYEGMDYGIDYLPVGAPVFVTAWWDADLNGILTSGDYWSQFPAFTTQSGQTVFDLTLDRKYSGWSALPWVPSLLLLEY